jgi:hypothetical protein
MRTIERRPGANARRSGDGHVMRTSSNVMWFIAVLLSLVGSVGADSRTEAEAQSQSRSQPPQAEVIYVDEMAPPKTLREMYADAALVLRATVEATGSPSAASRQRPVAIRRQRVRVLEVFKGDESPTIAGGDLTILQRGGTVNIDGREVTTEYPAPLLQPAEEVILFLLRGNEPHSYVIAYGAAGTFTIEHGNVVVPALVQNGMKEFAGKSTLSVAQFTTTLRGIRGKH